MKIKRKKGLVTGYTYSGKLEDEIAKLTKEKKKLLEVLPYLEFNYSTAKKAYEAKSTRLTHINDFIRLAQETLKEENNKEK